METSIILFKQGDAEIGVSLELYLSANGKLELADYFDYGDVRAAL